MYSERRSILEGEEVQELVDGFLDFVIEDLVHAHISGDAADDWDLDALWTDLKGYYTPGFTPAELADDRGGLGRLDQETLVKELKADIHANYEEREAEVGGDTMRELERQVLLSVLDRKWREHLYEMDYLKEGIGLRAMAQRDPLVEYKNEGFQMFQAMNSNIMEETVRYLFNFELPSERAAREAREAGERQAEAQGFQAATAGLKVTPEQLGIARRSRQENVSYSSSSDDAGSSSNAGASAGAKVAASGGNRAQRRAAKKAARKK